MTLHYLGKHEPRKSCLFSHVVYRVSKTTLLLLAISSTLIISVFVVYFHPLLDEEQLSTVQFWDSNRHHQRRGERWPTMQQAFSSDVALLRIARRVDAIVLQVDWRRYSEHFSMDMTFSSEKKTKSTACCGNFWSTSRSVVFETRYTAWLRNTIFRVYFSLGSAETLVMRGGITNHHLIAYSLSNISAKNRQNRLMCVKVIVCNISVVFRDTV